METIVRRCPFLSRVPQAFLQKAGKSLLFYAQNCPKMMEVGAKPAPRSLSTSAVCCQQIKETPPANEKAKTAQGEGPLALDGPRQASEGTQPPSGHPSPATGQGAASKCPFLAAQMSQGGSSVFRRASLELQEDVQEMHAVRKEVAQSAACPAVASAKADGAEPGGLLKSFQDIVRKQRPERVSHLLQDNLPKSISTFQYDHFFEKKIDEKKNDHTYRVFKTVNRRAHLFPMADDYSDSLITKKQVSVWCSNDYLGMSRHPRVCGAVMDTLRQHGAGAGGTRNISGTSKFHVDLEQELADLHGKDAALLFSSCFVANDSTLFTLAKMMPGCEIYSDAGNHASMIQGIRNSRVPKFVFRHNDAGHLRELLQRSSPAVPKIVAFETVHSMDGTSERSVVFPQGPCARWRSCAMWPMSLEPSPLWTRSMQWGCTGLEAEGLAIGTESWQKWTSFLEHLVADAAKNTEVCDQLMSRHNIYVQAINHPTVPRGEELLRIAPTPHHTPQMMSYFLENLLATWKRVGLELKPHSSAECNFCRRPLHFEVMSEREKSFFSGMSRLVSAQA
uniref:5'-aminolevulinate synthase 1 n=1 Tax=Rousettus aegyptiacus TaxID=9407 RepID=A0A7J8HLA8_ROUAE|nr:5'-aminolevulinate synthase 1 [Rousettus aegyptiacus]